MTTATWTTTGEKIDNRHQVQRDMQMRRQCRVTNTNVPVIWIGGDWSPTVTGAAGGHFTRSGDRIAHPGAYGRKGLGNMVYRSDSRVITVGRDYKHAK